MRARGTEFLFLRMFSILGYRQQVGEYLARSRSQVTSALRATLPRVIAALTSPRLSSPVGGQMVKSFRFKLVDKRLRQWIIVARGG